MQTLTTKGEENMLPPKASISANMFVIIFSFFTLSIGFHPILVRSEIIELGYDDGEANAGVSDLANKTYGWGVIFNHPEPGKPYRIRDIKIYVYMIKGFEKGLLRMFIYTYKPAIGAYIQRAQMIIDNFSAGWNLINLTMHTIIVTRNFIIGVNWVKNYIIYLGDDHDTSCNSGGFNATKITGFEHFEERNFMIHALVQEVTPPRKFVWESVLS